MILCSLLFISVIGRSIRYILTYSYAVIQQPVTFTWKIQKMGIGLEIEEGPVSLFTGSTHSSDTPVHCVTKLLTKKSQCPAGKRVDCYQSVNWEIDMRVVHSISSISVYSKGLYNCYFRSIQIHAGNSHEDDSTTNPVYANITNFTQRQHHEFDQIVLGRYVYIFSQARSVVCEVKICYTRIGSPFKLIREKLRWEDALYYCRDRDMELASILDQEAQSWAELDAQTANTPFVWLGLRYTCTLGFWFWVEDHALKFSRWSPTDKKEECDMSVAMKTEKDHRWYSTSDDKMFNFLCAK